MREQGRSCDESLPAHPETLGLLIGVHVPTATTCRAHTAVAIEDLGGDFHTVSQTLFPDLLGAGFCIVHYDLHRENPGRGLLVDFTEHNGIRVALCWFFSDPHFLQVESMFIARKTVDLARIDAITAVLQARGKGDFPVSEDGASTSSPLRSARLIGFPSAPTIWKAALTADRLAITTTVLQATVVEEAKQARPARIAHTNRDLVTD